MGLYFRTHKYDYVVLLTVNVQYVFAMTQYVHYLKSKPDLCGNPVRTRLTTLVQGTFLCICQANQGEFTQPRHGVPRVGMGLDDYFVRT